MAGNVTEGPSREQLKDALFEVPDLPGWTNDTEGTPEGSVVFVINGEKVTVAVESVKKVHVKTGTYEITGTTYTDSGSKRLVIQFSMRDKSGRVLE